jgi:uncharacterized membrane protein YecN with MAPEG domain
MATMATHLWPALVTLAALLLCIALGLNVGRARHRSKIEAPAVAGDPGLERAFRVHYNTLEWLAPFLGSMWLFAVYWDDRIAAGLGAVWIVGRVLYARAYMADPATRGPGFGVQALATLVLLLGAAGRVIWLLASGAG